ncbi:hypothetical protein [Pararhodobacter sp. SW119]|uniref:hypothetical protein n=1 Tax=Pararhodobacter sp. SW119 TaxID=2780075 RepID=UPI001ADEF3A3|nr:hypothetical protein [Pararhodobacter sp. SW119]
MPQLDISPEFPIGRACIDRAEIRIDGFSLRGVNALEAFHTFIHEAGLPTGDPELRLFHSTSLSRLRHPFRVGTSTGKKDGYNGNPVFSGKLEGRSDNSSILRFSFDGKMNVTRAIQAQRLIGRVGTARPRRCKDFSLLLSRSAKKWSDEHALTKEDNLLVGPDLRFSYAMSRAPSAHFVELLRNVERAIAGPLNEASERYNAQAEVSLGYILKGLEVYWEFSTPYPVSTVDLLAPKLQGAVNRSRTTARAVRLMETGRLQQSRSIQIDLGRNLLLRVYAKTNKRVRFEVSWGRDAIAREVGRRSALDAERLIETVDRLVVGSSQRLTELFREISPPVYGTVDAATFDDLLRAVGRAHPDPVICAMVLEGLRHHDRVVSEGCQPLLEAVRRLKRQGVLRVIRPYQGWYGLTLRYADALESLRISDNGKSWKFRNE